MPSAGSFVLTGFDVSRQPVLPCNKGAVGSRKHTRSTLCPVQHPQQTGPCSWSAHLHSGWFGRSAHLIGVCMISSKSTRLPLKQVKENQAVVKFYHVWIWNGSVSFSSNRRKFRWNFLMGHVWIMVSTFVVLQLKICCCIYSKDNIYKFEKINKNEMSIFLLSK